MYLLLTDHLTCPRCGPEFGLILLAERIVDRRVLGGTLGCPNCRDRYPVREGFGDLRAPPRGKLATGLRLVENDPEGPSRLAALLGVARGPATVLLMGPVAAQAGALTDLVPELEVVALGAWLAALSERPGISRLVATPGLPFRSGSLSGVVMEGEGPVALAEAARVLSPSSRLVVLNAPRELPDAVSAAGLQLLVHAGGTLVAERGVPRKGLPGRTLPVV